MNIPKWHVMENKIGKWYWHKKAGNGLITASSGGDDFSSKREALKAVTRDAFPWYVYHMEDKYKHGEILGYMLDHKDIVIHEPGKDQS